MIVLDGKQEIALLDISVSKWSAHVVFEKMIGTILLNDVKELIISYKIKRACFTFIWVSADSHWVKEITWFCLMGTWGVAADSRKDHLEIL